MVIQTAKTIYNFVPNTNPKTLIMMTRIVLLFSITLFQSFQSMPRKKLRL